MNDEDNTYTSHGVLAAAYTNQNSPQLLVHASIDGGEHAVCARVRPGHLADDLGEPLSCPHCSRIVEKFGMTMQPGSKI